MTTSQGRLARFELKSFLAGKGVAAGLVLILLAGAGAIEHGRRMIDAQKKVLAATEQRQESHRAKMLKLHGKDGTGNLLYYLQFFTVREPSRFAPAAVGLRDVAPYNLKVGLLTLEGQIRNAEIGNPEAQSLGAFDLAFLLAFLYPLLMIAFLHNVWSEEAESGTWRLIRSMPVSPARVLLRKAGLRWTPIVAVWLATLAAAVWLLELPADGRLAAWIGLSLGYLAFWFAISLAVISLGRPSNFNAMALLAVWAALAVVLPVTANLGIATWLPATDGLDAVVRQREGYHNKWDRPRAETMRAFYTRHPEMAGYPVPDDRFSWGWYYAMQQQGDEESAEAATRYRAAQELREVWAWRLAWLAPPALIQSAVGRLAGTDLPTHLAYLDSVRAYHERLRRQLYPAVFQDTPAPAIEWGSMPRHRFRDEDQTPRPAPWVDGAILLGEALALGEFARRRLRKAAE